MPMKWHGAQAVKLIDMEVGKRVDAAARFVRNEARKILSRDQPTVIYGKSAGRSRKGLDPSRPGEPPKKVTGDLRLSITKEFDRSTMTAQVGTRFAYGRFLELGTRSRGKGKGLLARPWLRPVLVNNQGQIRRRFGIGVKI